MTKAERVLTSPVCSGKQRKAERAYDFKTTMEETNNGHIFLWRTVSTVISRLNGLMQSKQPFIKAIDDLRAYTARLH